MAEVSLIIPVYNTERLLAQCLDSVLVQTYTDFECILVNDGSTDRCGEICDQYVQRDRRIRVIHQENKGVSGARNAALDSAEGRFIVFIDSDDAVGKDYLLHLIDNQGEDALVITDKVSCDSDLAVLQSERRESGKLIRLDHASAQDSTLLMQDYLIYGPYCKLYRHDLIEQHHLRYDTSLTSAEDFDFNMRYIQHVGAIQYIPAYDYFYRTCYKKSTLPPANESSVKSAHLMAADLLALAERMGVLNEVQPFIAARTAEKHYLNRVPQVFSDNCPDRSYRKTYFQKLYSDSAYYDLCRSGRAAVMMSRKINAMSLIDRYFFWNAFYAVNRLLRPLRRRNSAAGNTQGRA